MKYFLSFLLIFFLISCGTLKNVYVPVQGENIIEFRDTTIYIRDTITVEIPKEVIIEKIPQIDTSNIETSIAKSIAYLDTTEKKLVHKLENKSNAELKTKLDTLVKVVYKNQYIEKPIIQEVEVPKPYIPKWALCIIIYGIISAVWTIAKLYFKFK